MSTTTTTTTKVIVGAGLSGLTATLRLAQAHLKQQQQKDDKLQLVVLEARDRVGGRTLTTAEGVDFGASWCWPQHNPSLMKLINELLQEHVQVVVDEERYDGSCRFQPGAQAISQGLLHRIEEISNQHKDRLEFSLELNAVTKRIALMGEGQEVSVTYEKKAEQQSAFLTTTLVADTVFLALPPRLVEASIEFNPPLPAKTKSLLTKSRTWMAPQGKWAAVYERPLWKDPAPPPRRRHVDGPMDGLFNFTTSSGKGVVWGFLSHNTKWRQRATEDQRRTAALAQIQGQLGIAPNSSALLKTLEYDWKQDPFACCKLDAQQPDPWDHPYPLATADVWNAGVWGQSRVLCMGSETDTQFTGFLEGAVRAAEARVKAHLNE